MKKKIIVTGGCGFIGSHLVEKLSENKNNNIFVIDNLYSGKISNLPKKKNIHILKYDISKNLLNLKKYLKNTDILFHLAALADIVPSIENPSEYFNTNVSGTLNLLEISKKFNIKKFVYAASSSCYGIPSSYPTNENATLSTEYPYAASKKMGEDLVMHWAKVYNINCTSLRLFNVYGPRSRTSGAYGAVFGVFLAQKIKNKPLTIVGNGKQSRDFIFVTDVVSAFIKAGNLKKNFQKINIGSGKPITINYIANKISNKKIFIPKRPGEPNITHANIFKARSVLNWKPKIKISKGIELMLRNIDFWKNAKVWTPFSIKKTTKSWFKYLK
jgi:UDP-glucose 4-epimerase